jgi:hypothetical protein
MSLVDDAVQNLAIPEAPDQTSVKERETSFYHG